MKIHPVRQVLSFFVLYGILFIPFPFRLFPVQQDITGFLFGPLIRFTGEQVFGRIISPGRIISDSISLFILLLWLLALSILTVLLLSLFRKGKEWQLRLAGMVNSLAIFYVSLILMKYGMDKVFKNQFYLPEPNTLYAPIGSVSKGFLYWTSMGTSYGYNLFLGSVEILASLFLLIRKTRLAGLLLSTGILLNIVAVNFGFDISVKVFSLFLLFLVFFLLQPYGRSLFFYFFRQEQTRVPGSSMERKPGFLKMLLPWLAAGLIIAESLYPFITTGRFNGDRAPGPFLHGAYTVTRAVAGSDTLGPASSPVKRFFIHSKGYLVYEDQDEKFIYYTLEYDKGGQLLWLTGNGRTRWRMPFSYDAANGILVLSIPVGNREYLLTGKSLDWKNLPLLQERFHWMTDKGKSR